MIKALHILIGVSYAKKICNKHSGRHCINKIKFKQETLRIVRIAVICFTFLHFENFIISGGLYITQLNIYDGALIEKIVSRFLYSQKSSIVDIHLGPKNPSAFWRLFKQFTSLKYFKLWDSWNLLFL